MRGYVPSEAAEIYIQQERKLMKAEKERDKLKAENEKLKRNIKTLKNTVNILEANISSTIQDFRCVKKENVKLKNRITQLESVYERIDSLCEYIGTELGSLTQKMIEGKETE